MKKLLIIVGVFIVYNINAWGQSNVYQADSQENRSSIKNMLPDIAITASIKTKFAADDTINVFDITVKTINGNVELSGNVPNINIKNRAANIARSIKGVINVNTNNLHVDERLIGLERGSSPANYLSDSAITSSIKAKLVAYSKVSTFAISIETINGVVKLRGKVNSRDVMNKIISIAKETEGVREVISELEIPH